MATEFTDYLVTCRSFAEYLAMFALDERQLAGMAILDCPAGAASFAADAGRWGAKVICADTAYSLQRSELFTVSAADSAKGNAYIVENPGNFTWSWFESPVDHMARRTSAHETFRTHFAAAEGSYVCARLPHLPFADGTFGLTLSSHFLFTYADRLDEDFHYETLAELARVTSGDVRIFPLLSFEMARYPYLNDLRTRLDGLGISSEVRQVDYEFQQGADEMLVLSRYH
ncbi:MAG: hypothetical protein DCC49_05630 [Acidobacteria bacterium]|nr:MAG: hypothetical protein DCC49_05630 [Acidobacteriota bacterium]